jgi:hypothetical protein
MTLVFIVCVTIERGFNKINNYCTTILDNQATTTRMTIISKGKSASALIQYYKNAVATAGKKHAPNFQLRLC